MSLLKDKAAHAARRLGLVIAGSACCLAGLGFLTVSLWLYLAAIMPPTHASLGLGLAYLGIGLILFSLGRSNDEPKAAAEPSKEPETTSPFIQAFLYGLEAGRQAGKRRH